MQSLQHGREGFSTCLFKHDTVLAGDAMRLEVFMKLQHQHEPDAFVARFRRHLQMSLPGEAVKIEKLRQIGNLVNSP